MKTRHATRLGATLAACALLAACAVGPTRPPPKPAVVIARPEPPPTTSTPLAPDAGATREPWASLTASFVMHDCNGSPLVRARLAAYTRSPAHFARMLRQSLPLMLYVHDELQSAGIPGEFVMLPMLESGYDPSEPSRRSDPAGMWQLMPATARRHGIVIDRHYDGRLDPIASTGVAIAMLSAFGEKFDDWRLADMAYNAGPHAVAVAMRKHPDPGGSAVPDIAISATSRKHLAKLMALSCILREPGRFHVKLPQLSRADRLVAVQAPAGLKLRDAASKAEISEAELRALNPGYLGARIPAQSPGMLLLPAAAADALAAALAVDTSETVARVDTSESASGPSEDLPLPAVTIKPASDRAPVHSVTHHRVRKGESLWSIAHHYGVSVDDLKRWNQLRGNDIRPGEELRVRG